MLILFPGSAGDLSPFEVVTLNTSPDRLVFLLSEDAGSGRVGGDVSKCSLYVFTIILPRLTDQCNFITVL